MPFRWLKPDRETIQRLLLISSESELTYPEVGATRFAKDRFDSCLPQGYAVDHNRILLGRGLKTFERAKQAIQQWKMFEIDWIETCFTTISPKHVSMKVGLNMAVLVRAKLWSLNPCRVVYTIDEPIELTRVLSGNSQTVPGTSHQKIIRFGFGYGTLPGHVEMGEERFQVEYDPAEELVWYDLLSFSRPNHLLAKLGFAVVRRYQQAFARDSKAAMYRACQTS